MFSQRLKQEKNALNGGSSIGGFKFPVNNTLETVVEDDDEDLYS